MTIYRQLSYNDIPVIDNNTFSNLPNLQKLYLRNNKIISIKSDTFNNLMNLKELSLKNNNISFVSEKAFVNLPKLTSLAFDMYCGGCDNIPFWRWLRKQTTISVTCNDYDGKSLSNLQLSNFTGCFPSTKSDDNYTAVYIWIGASIVAALIVVIIVLVTLRYRRKKQQSDTTRVRGISPTMISEVHHTEPHCVSAIPMVQEQHYDTIQTPPAVSYIKYNKSAWKWKWILIFRHVKGFVKKYFVLYLQEYAYKICCIGY